MAETFGQRIKALRKRAGMTQQELATAAAARLKDEKTGRGFDVTYLSKIENDRMPPPSAKAIIVLASLLHEDQDHLLGLAKRVAPDMQEQIATSRGAQIFYRSALNSNLTDADWKRLLEHLKAEHPKKKKGDK